VEQRENALLSERAADVIVVGAGPAGCTAAYYLAQAGLDVLLLEKTAFPREKVCGDGLTPRAVRALIRMGIDTSPAAGWVRNRGLRVVGGGMRLDLAWPELASYPEYGLVRPRRDFDHILARQAVKAGARLCERVNVTGPVLDEDSGRIVGVTAKTMTGDLAEEVTFHAPVVVAADGNSTQLSLAMGLHKRDDRPMGVAVRTYFRSPRHDDDWLETWLDLRAGDTLLPGYGWIFGVGDGTSNVGLGLLNPGAKSRHRDYRDLLWRWLAGLPAEWGFDKPTQTQPVRGAALPMGFNRTPHYTRGLLLVGDAGGLVNPFTGEGIAYAMESGEMAADVIAQARTRSTAQAQERTLRSYPQALKGAYGGYYTLGNLFVKLINKSTVMNRVTRRGLDHPRAMRFAFKLFANLAEPRGGDATDRIINALNRLTPAA